jgi:hypothetical protein
MATAHSAELGRLTTGDTGKSGIAQIKNPFARVGLQIADAIGGGLFPGIEQRLPGTEGHHDVLVRQAQRNVANDEAAAANEAKNSELAAQVREDDAKAQALANPQDEFTPIPTSTGYVGVSRKTGEAQPITVNGQQAQPVEKTVQPHFTVNPVTGEVIGIHTDPKTGQMHAELVYKGDPKIPTSIANLQVGGKPHSVIVNSQTGETIKDLGESGIKPPTVNVNAGTAALDREGGRFAKNWDGVSKAAGDQLEKINEAQSMINGNAESQALGIPKVLTALVSGMGTGVRITQAELNQLAHARGLQGDFEGTLRKLSGKGQLSQQQQTELNGVLEDVKEVIAQKQQIANDALDGINFAKSRDEIIQADKGARQKLQDMQSGKSAPTQQKWEATATGKDGHQIGYRGGKWYDIQSGKAIQ